MTATSGAGVVGMAPDATEPRPRQLHIRLPQHLTPMPGSRLDEDELEEWIVGAFMVNYIRLWEAPPCVATLALISGRSAKRVKRALARMEARGWIGQKKLRNEFAPGRFGHKWRIWLMRESPLRELLDSKRGDGFKWIAVPATVAQYRSVLATACYLVLHEQRRVDGAIVTTPSELGSLLGCDRSTSRRLLEFVGAVPVIEIRPGRGLYDLPLIFDQREDGVVTFGQREAIVRGNRTRLEGRLALLRATLEGLGFDPEIELELACAHLQARGRTVRLDLVIRFVEEERRRELMGVPEYRARLALRLASRMRSFLRKPSRTNRHVAAIYNDADLEERNEIRRAIADALQHQCSTCADDRRVIVTEGAHEFEAPCPACSSA